MSSTEERTRQPYIVNQSYMRSEPHSEHTTNVTNIDGKHKFEWMKTSLFKTATGISLECYDVLLSNETSDLHLHLSKKRMLAMSRSHEFPLSGGRRIH